MAREDYFPKSNFLRAEDIRDKQMVTVDKFEAIKTQIGTRPIIRLEGFEAPLGLNATNYDAMVAMFGDDENDWSGRQIRLLIRQAPNPKKGGKEQDVIRIENTSDEKLKATAKSAAKKVKGRK